MEESAKERRKALIHIPFLARERYLNKLYEGFKIIIGVAKEIKNNESWVGLTHGGTYVLCKAGHAVMIEKAAGLGSGFHDEDY